jgi:DNA repair protein RecN (Recombination protein N)
MTKSFFLKNIILNNFVTFTHQNIDFVHNFNAIVGETGSGKSLILEALQLIFGGRSDKKLIRKDSEFCSVECIFHCTDPEIKEFFDNNGFPFLDNEITLKRIIYHTGKSKTFINFQSANVASLLKFSRRYIDIVGQFENQKLLSSTYQLKLLDSYSSQKDLCADYLSSYKDYKALLQERESLTSKQAEKEQRIDYLQYQLNEIEVISPSQVDYQENLNKKDLFKNIEQISKFQQQVSNLISFEGAGSPILQKLHEITSIHNKNSNFIASDSISKVYEAIDLISSYEQEVLEIEKLELSDEEISNIINRLDKYNKLQSKFGEDISKIISKKDEFVKELEMLNNFTNNFKRVDQQIKATLKYLSSLADKLHSTRIRYAKDLSKELTKSIRSLKMSNATIDISVNKLAELNEYGSSSIEILTETNPGEGFHKMASVASGGELSRILLSFRKILSSKDSISIFLFDEIDTGIGGETALAIGENLGTVADGSQVIAITHLPQIANYANSIINVVKKSISTDGTFRTFSDVNIIAGKAKSKFIQAMNPLN